MRIRREDVENVRERSSIEEVVGEHVSLRSAGVGSMKGLCPFHDEKTPSFHVRPQVGMWHCFGCGEGGDVIAFVQKVDALPFAEAVERLASRLGYALHYEDDDGRGPARREQVGQRQRLIEAQRVAAQFFAEQLATSPDALAGRQFLSDRGFDREAAAHFGVGFAPRSGEALLKHLRGKAFTEDELLASGLARRGQRGLYDWFRGRLVWPIRDVAGDVVGFGARRLFEDDRIEAKYLNTPETAIYKKSQVLYGVDLAKRAIARDRQVVVVEGYTDVMACHLAGVETAVATCGTAFAADHIRIVRRLLGDDRVFGGEIVFTFDGDAAGQKAALRAFEEDQRFVAQTYIAIAADGMDPCELRQAKGDEAVRELVAARTPLFEFAIRAAMNQFDLDSAAGRVQAARAALPIVARIKDRSLRADGARRLARWVEQPEDELVHSAERLARGDRAPARPASIGAPQIDPRDPIARLERQALECMLQVPHLVPAADADQLGEGAFEVPALRAIHLAIRGVGGMAAAARLSAQAWAEAVRDEATEAVAPLVTELAVTPIPADSDEALARFAASVVLRVAEVDASRAIGTLRSRVQRLEPTDPGYQEAFADLLAAEARRRQLRDRISGG